MARTRPLLLALLVGVLTLNGASARAAADTGAIDAMAVTHATASRGQPAIGGTNSLPVEGPVVLRGANRTLRPMSWRGRRVVAAPHAARAVTARGRRLALAFGAPAVPSTHDPAVRLRAPPANTALLRV
jgi:hypothetical protein